MKKVLLAGLCLIMTFPVFATAFQYTYEGQTLNYSLDNGVCGVIDSRGLRGDIIIPDSVPYEGNKYAISYIADQAFFGSRLVTSITLPATIKSIGKSVFAYCRTITSITIPEGVEEIKYATFAACYSLREITLPSSLRTVHAMAFYDCTSLNSVEFSNPNATIGTNAFQNCYSLKSVTLPDSLVVIEGSAFDSCRSLTQIKIPESVTAIQPNAFSGAALTSIIIPDGVKNIRTGAFRNCAGLTSVELGNGLESIDQSAFDNCTSLKKVVSTLATPSSITTDGNKFIPENCELVVPAGSLDAYRNASWWNEFASIREDVKYSISLQVTGSGTLSCNGVATSSATISEGNTAIIATIPNEGWMLKSLLVDDVDVTDKVVNNEYSLEDVKENHVVSAVFVERPICLTIKYPGIGTAVHKMAKGTQFSTNFIAEHGWSLSSASWNGEDITSQFANGGEFTTPVLDSDAELSIALKEDNTSIESVSNDLVKITAYKGVITVTGAETGTRVSVKDIKGVVVANAKITDATQTISVNKSGVFIVNVDNATYKVAL